MPDAYSHSFTSLFYASVRVSRFVSFCFFDLSVWMRRFPKRNKFDSIVFAIMQLYF